METRNSVIHNLSATSKQEMAINFEWTFPFIMLKYQSLKLYNYNHIKKT